MRSRFPPGPTFTAMSGTLTMSIALARKQALTNGKAATALMLSRRGYSGVAMLNCMNASDAVEALNTRDWIHCHHCRMVRQYAHRQHLAIGETTSVGRRQTLSDTVHVKACSRRLDVST